MHPPDQPPRYHAYLLRMWEERAAARPPGAVWRFQVEDPHTGRRQGFVDLAALLVYLQQVVAPDQDRDGGAA